MKLICSTVILFLLLAAGCNNGDNIKSDNGNNEQFQNTKKKNLNVSGDTLIGGDIFISTGAAGKMEQKQGKIVLITGSGDVRPVLLKNDMLLVTSITGDTLNRISLAGNHLPALSENPDASSGNARLMLMTDDGEMLEVKLLGGELVAITEDNIMLPLEKK